MEILNIDKFENLYQAQKAVCEKALQIIDEHDITVVVTNLQLAAALQDAFLLSETSFNDSKTLDTQEGPYQFLEYEQTKFYIDPLMHWNDTKMLFLTMSDGESLHREYENMSYIVLKVESSKSLI